MVGSSPQHQCSSHIAPGRTAGRIMEETADAFATSAAAAEGGPAASSAQRGELERDAEPTAASSAPNSQAAPRAEEAALVDAPGRCVQAPALGIDWGTSMLDEIKRLKKEQHNAREKKKAATKELRNAERRRTRLKKRAKQLSDGDLLAVISLRTHEKALAAGGEEGDVSAESAEEDDEEETDAGGGSASACSASPAKKKTKRG